MIIYVTVKRGRRLVLHYSDWVYVIRGILQGLILDPLLFNIFIKEVQYTVCSEVNLAKWLSVRLRTKWLWVRVQLQSLRYNTLAVRIVQRVFIIVISSHSHIKRKQPQINFLRHSYSVTMINIVKSICEGKFLNLTP